MRVLLLAAMSVALMPAPSGGELRIIPVPPHVNPQWTPVEGAPGVYYAPNVPTDLFRYRGKYYFYWNGYLYVGKRPQGPWKSVKNIPDFFYKIDPRYFKTGAAGKAPAPGAASPAISAPPIPEIPIPGVPQAAPAPQPAAPRPGETVKPGI
jgi:hypothetical protein